MSSTALCAVILLACVLTFSAAQTSCKGRCGAEYYRGSSCQCDYNCLAYGECCEDFESMCTTKNSCRGRCGENFKRGRLCSCDFECVKYKQCCSDFKTHCDAEVITTEEISGSAIATAPEKTNSCHNVNAKKPKEPTVDEANDQTFTSSEGNNPDDQLIPLVATTHPPVSDDILSYDKFSNNGVDDPDTSPTPESTSGYGSPTADLLEQVSFEPTQDPNVLEFTPETFTVVTQTNNDATPAVDSLSTLYPDEGTDDPASSADPPQPTTAVDSTQPTQTSTPQTDFSTAANTPELDVVLQTEVLPMDDIFPQAQITDPSVVSTDLPEVITTTPSPTVASVSTGPTSVSSTALQDSQVTTNAEISTEGVTTAPLMSQTDLEDLSASVSPTGSKDLSELEETTTHTLSVTSDPKPASTEATSKPQDLKPPSYKPLPAKPSPKPETKPLDPAETLNIDDSKDYQADDSNDTNLCSGRPVSGVTTLRNGTTVVFRGHYFWFLDRNRVPGPARGITQVWGIPSPIDTVFTRCNCQGKTYIFKGPQYWRFDNDVLDSGYPKMIETGFDGLRGHITAALSVPQYQRRRESVYFFKRGGTVQRYSYQFGTSPTCGRKPKFTIYTVRHRMVRQAVSLLGPTINIRTSWKGFPSTITSAVSVPNTREPEGYKYYVFSRSKSYNVRMDGERPVIAVPTVNTSPQSSSFFNCPQKV